MSDNLKSKTIRNVVWSTIDKAGQQVIYIGVYILLANLLTPEDYGLIGVLTIFMAISSVMIDSGFSSALIHKKAPTEQDYSSVFYFNLFLSVGIYLLLYSGASLIADIFGDERLVVLSRITFLAIIANSLGIIHGTQLNKELDFVSLTKINFLSLLISSVTTVWLAVKGYGVWALVAQTVVLSVAKFLLYLLFNRWYPRKHFRLAPIQEFLPYSSRLLGAGLLNAVFDNIYAPFIRTLGYPLSQVGIYTQANKLQEIPALLISNTFKSVSFPTLASVKEDEERMNCILSKTVRTIAFIGLPVMWGLAVTGDSFILLILPERWAPSIVLFRILCFAGMISPFLPLFVNLLLAKGASKKYLHLEIITKSSLLVFLVLGSFAGIKGIAGSWIAYNYLAVGVALVFTRKISGYGFRAFWKDLRVYFFSSVVMAVAVYSLSWIVHDRMVLLPVQCITGILLYTGCMKFFSTDIYLETEEIVKRRIRKPRS
ncbi:MAG: lipopolysaccharide biosynthesis protein [Bacteroides sp.]|nr:lipopolysaccharide biosynthesis protein [Bacteroides sp.]